ncbi:hypothetical protein FB451DRAFT_751623 [Mycena latifolia]|nr:hypothetical protein FB451DRAFT_751623 [Mycena latifolia]
MLWWPRLPATLWCAFPFSATKRLINVGLAVAIAVRAASGFSTCISLSLCSTSIVNLVASWWHYILSIAPSAFLSIPKSYVTHLLQPTLLSVVLATDMPLLSTFRLTKARSRRYSSSPRGARKLNRTKTSPTTVATVELDSKLPSIRVVRKPRKTFKRRLILIWKRISSPSRPRASRRFSFMPPDFALVSHDEHLKSRDSRGGSKYCEAMPAE